MFVYITYLSKFGNTERLAKSMADAVDIQEGHPIYPIDRFDASRMRSPALLIIGGPTQDHGAPMELKEFVAALPAAIFKKTSFAVFDTRYRKMRLRTGSAAAQIAFALLSRGAHLVVPAESYFVEGEKGPLLAGEIERAETWADIVIAEACRRASDPEIRPGFLEAEPVPA